MTTPTDRTPEEQTTISPKRVRYIKLGRHGAYEKECLDKGIARFSFDSGTEERFALCREGRWGELAQTFSAEGKNKGTVTRFTNETRLFFEDDGSMLWVTFIGERMYWGFLEPTPAARHESGDGVFRKVKGGWRWMDLRGVPLTKDRLSGNFTKLAGFRGTTCDVMEAEYVVRRINGQKTPEVERAVSAVNVMTASTLEMIRLLGPKDFELLVDLVFTASGWRRQGVVGKTQKTLDLDLILPSTGERAFVQVKSETNQQEFEEYVAKFEELGIFDRMFYAYHSTKGEDHRGQGHGEQIKGEDERVTVIGPEHLAELVVDAGLANWLIRKVS